MASESLEEAVRDHALAFSEITNLIDDRFHPLRREDLVTFAHPPDETPAITYGRFSSEFDLTQTNDSRLAMARVRYFFWSESYLTAKEVEKEFYNIFHGLKKTIGDDLVDVQMCKKLNDEDEYENDSQEYSVTADYKFWYREK